MNTLSLIEPTTLHYLSGGALLVIGFSSLLAFLLRRKISMRGVMALHMLNLMVVLISLFVIFQPKGQWLGGLCMFTLLAMIWMFSRFENTDKA